MKVELREQGFDPWAEVKRHQQLTPELTNKFGATAVFVGTMRDFNEGDAVQSMSLEYYPKMTAKHLEKISEQALERWDILDTVIIHRVGTITPNDPIVLVAVWSAHRAAAFDACRFLMEELKSTAPFWKKESLEGGQRWVQSNTPG